MNSELTTSRRSFLKALPSGDVGGDSRAMYRPRAIWRTGRSLERTTRM